MIDVLDLASWRGLAVTIAVLAATLACMARWPTAGLAAAILSLAVRPELILGGPATAFAWGLSHTLLVLALVTNAARYGIRTAVNWPVMAMIVAFLLSLLFGALHPQLTLPAIATCLALFILPWTAAQIVLAPGTRQVHALVIALTPAVSVVAEALLDLAGIIPNSLFLRIFLDHLGDLAAGRPMEPAIVFRLAGATGNPGAFALLALAGLAAAMCEWVRTHKARFAVLAAINGGFIILSGTRMALLASGILLLVYVGASTEVRRRIVERWRVVLASGALALAALIVYLPVLRVRLPLDLSEGVNLAGRGTIWRFYVEEFLLSPVFGRGFGAGLIAMADVFDGPHTTPHNDYLHLLVSGGMVGFLLCLAAIVCWLRWLFRAVDEADRPFLLALLAALALYATGWDVLIFSTALPLFTYLSVLLIRPRRVVKRIRRRSHKSVQHAPAAGILASEPGGRLAMTVETAPPQPGSCLRRGR